MNQMRIKTDGYCVDNFINNIKRTIDNSAVESLKNTACGIVENCVDTYSSEFGIDDVGIHGRGFVTNPYKGEIPNVTTGLIYGKVQSGKTNVTILSLAIAQANGFRCFIVLTSDNTSLGKQTADRFRIHLKGGPVVYDWEQWKTDPKGFADSKVREYIKSTGVVLISTKNSHHLKNLLDVLRYSEAKNLPTIIFDDEADNASLNTNESKQARRKGENIADSAIFDKIGSIRKEVGNHIYLQITATPQSLLLQNLDHPCKPAFCAALPQPGSSYMGGDLFFREGSLYCCNVEPREIDDLKNQEGDINPGNNWNIPEGLKLALCCFFIAAIYKMQSDYEAKYSFLAHVCYKKNNHTNLDKIITAFIIELDKSLRGEFGLTKEQTAKKILALAYEELCKTAIDLPPMEDLIEKLKHELRNVAPNIVNADNPDKELNCNPGMNILIGGNRLGRGVTIEGLMVTYYGRDAKQKTMDTVHQHARMFGYRQKLKDVTRLFLPKHILEDFRSIHEADEGMRQSIGEDPSSMNIKAVWVGKTLQPTRSNVLNPAAIDAFIPGSAIFPRDPLWKLSDIKQHTEDLKNLLSEYNDDNECYSVNIDMLMEIIQHMPSKYCTEYKWNDSRILEVMKAMKEVGIEKGILNIRRGKNGSGLELKNRIERPWRGSGFANSKWISDPKGKYPNLPILIVMYQKGEKVNGWDCPLYLPTLILPESRFVFMFNSINGCQNHEDIMSV
jgi:Z1 domain